MFKIFINDILHDSFESSDAAWEYVVSLFVDNIVNIDVTYSVQNVNGKLQKIPQWAMDDINDFL